MGLFGGRGRARSRVSEASLCEEFGLTGRKVLLVEDNTLTREIAAELLEEYGFEVTTVVNGAEALSAVESAEPGAINLILMDIRMPVMDGYEATRRIRALPQGAAIPIVAMTASAEPEDRQAALDSGMNEHIAKPIDIDRLKEALVHFLG